MFGKFLRNISLDNLSNGYRDAVLFDAVMHFASFIQVGESVEKPAMYYQNNLTNTLHLLDTMVVFGIKHFIFYFTAAVYGNLEYTPIDVIHLKQPINPYGKSKWMVEQALEDCDKAYGLKSVCLRDFNAAGVDPDGEPGERHKPWRILSPSSTKVRHSRL